MAEATLRETLEAAYEEVGEPTPQPPYRDAKTLIRVPV